MKKYSDILHHCRLFEGIDDSDLSAIFTCFGAKVGSFERNRIIFQEGTAAAEIGIVLSGTVQIVRVDFYGNRSITASIPASGLFGESFVCAGLDSVPVSVVAAEACEVLFVNGGRLLHSCGNACEFHSRMIFNLMKVMAEKNLLFHQKIEITSQRTTRGKLMTYLLLCAKQQNSSSFTIPYDRQALADFLEVDRSGLSAEISRLRREGVLECRKNWFRLCESQQL